MVFASRIAKPVTNDSVSIPAVGRIPDPGCVPSHFSGSGLRPSVSLSSWARSVAGAPETSKADAAERSADRAADAAVRSEPSARTVGAASAPDVGTPPWGTGRPLSPPEREWHEPHLGAGLGDVRVHEGAAPGRWARMLGARAFSIGRDVVFGAGEYTPGTQAGRHLMAHELSHVIAGRGRAPVLARVALTAADFETLADSIHSAVQTPASDAELIFVALQKLERNAAAITSLRSAYRRRFRADLLTDLGRRLRGHELGLARTLLAQAGGLQVSAAPPGSPAQFESTARAVNAALTGRAVDPERVYAALIPLGRAAAAVGTLKTTYTRLFSTDIEADLTARLADASRSYALYLLQAPGPASTHAPTGYVAQPGFGGTPRTDPVPGGTVSAGKAVPYSYQRDPAGPPSNLQFGFGFGYGYSGALSSDTRWLQFIKREINSTTGTTTTPVTGNVTSGRRTYPLTTDATHPNWSVDSNDPSDPFFDEAHPGESWRDATTVSAYDSPSWGRQMNRQVLPSTGAATSLPRDRKDALVAQYPAFAYIR